jgi:hypothetical protein
MRKLRAGLGSLALAAGLATTYALSAPAAPPEGTAAQPAVVDELPNPAEEKRRALREVALQKVLSGDAKVRQRGASEVVKVADDQYVELAHEKTDKIFVILAEFGDTRHASYPDQDTNKNIPGPATFNGPLHNAIPAPDRSKDNSTVWQPDYDRAHYQDIYFGDGESLKTYYEKQSSGRYSVEGQVTDWVKVPYNEARYGRSDGYPCASNVCSNTWALIRDAIDTWVAARKAAGATDATIAEELASYDSWDRNDYDDDGNFNERDGYIDHFQIVHSGGDQADGDPHQGEDAIWSHRWKAFQGNTRTAARRSAAPASGSPTTRSSPRTAACPCSRTSTGTISACPTTTTPRAVARTASTGGRSWARAASRRPRTRPSAPARPTSARGTSSSSAGSTTRSCRRVRPARSSWARTSTTAPRRRAWSSRCRRRPWSPTSARRRPGPSSGGPARTTTTRPR